MLATGISRRPHPAKTASSTADVVIVDRLCKAYDGRNARRQSLAENLVVSILRIGRSRECVNALADISFRVRRGESLGVIGGNGSGKSTLLKIIAGIAAPSSGQVEVRARVATQLASGSAFNPFLTGRENAFLFGSVLGVSNRRVRALLPAIAQFAALESAIDRPLWTFSTGMVARLGIAVAVHAEFELLLLDEAASSADVWFRERCTAALLGLKRSGATMIIADHDCEQLEQLCDRVLWLQSGTIAALGPARDVIGRYLDAKNGGNGTNEVKLVPGR